MAPTRHFGGSSVCERLYCAPPARLPTLFLGFERFQGVARRKISASVGEEAFGRWHDFDGWAVRWSEQREAMNKR